MPEVERDLWTLRESAASQFGRPGAYRGRRDLLRAMLPRLFGGEIMIGWKPPAKAKRRAPPNAGQVRAIAKGIERKAVKAFWQKVDTFDALNLHWADEWLQQRAELGDDHHRIVYAMAVMARLRPELEF